MNLMLGSEVQEEYTTTLNFRTRTGMGPGDSTTLRSAIAIDITHEFRYPDYAATQNEFQLEPCENTNIVCLGAKSFSC